MRTVPDGKKWPKSFLNRLRAVKAKRARTVIDHILKHGQITTEELRERYGYDHPPRAARDVREQGIPLETFWIKGSHGRKIAAYRFDDPAKIRGGQLRGREAWAKGLKLQLVQQFGERCGICLTQYEPRYLQIDHRVPYEVSGDPQDSADLSALMLLCGSCNRAKSWSCEHCKNWREDRQIQVCNSCYWASPDNHAHVALRLVPRLDITWTGDEVPEHDRLVSLSRYARKRLPEYVKEVLRERLGRESAADSAR